MNSFALNRVENFSFECCPKQLRRTFSTLSIRMENDKWSLRCSVSDPLKLKYNFSKNHLSSLSNIELRNESCQDMDPSIYKTGQTQKPEFMWELATWARAKGAMYVELSWTFRICICDIMHLTFGHVKSLLIKKQQLNRSVSHNVCSLFRSNNTKFI